MLPSVPEALDIKTISTARLLRKIVFTLDHEADSNVYSLPEQDSPEAAPVEANAHFKTVRLVLRHLLGDDIRFSTESIGSPDAGLETKLSTLYQSTLTRTLVATVLRCPEDAVTPLMVHQFFARIAWLDESKLITQEARDQLGFYVDGYTAFWDEAIILGEDNYSELGGLLTPIPTDLQYWMVQFKRGERSMPIVEWITLSSASALYNGLAVADHEYSEENSVESEPHSVFASVVASLLPSHGGYEDDVLMLSLSEQLDSAAMWVSIEHYLRSIPALDAEATALPIDLSTPMSAATRREFFRKIAVYVFNPDNEPWLDLALENARNASEMRALSVATALCLKHPELAPELALRIGSLLLPLEHPDLQVTASLPDVRVLTKSVPPLSTWSTARGVNDLFQQLGIDVLCEPKDATRVLRFSARETWQALMQTAQFKTMFSPMLTSMGWYGASANEQSSPRITQALAGRAIVEFFLGVTGAHPESFETFLFSQQVTEYSHNELVEHLRKNISAHNRGASPSSNAMLEYLLLREWAPELLVEGVPDHLHYGRSLQSVSFLQGVVLLETLAPGRAQSNGFDDIVGLTADMSQSDDPAVHALWAKTRVLPALRYAIAHGAIEWSGDDNIRTATAAQITQALQYLSAQQALHAQELNRLLSLKTPDRLLIAQQQLSEANVPESYWNVPPYGHAVRQFLDGLGLSVSSSYSWDAMIATPGSLEDVGAPQTPVHRPTLVELMVMGEFYVRGRPTVSQAYEQAFDVFHQALTSAEGAVIKRLLAEMPISDTALLATSTCEVSRVKFDSQEGAQGIFIRCQSGDHRHDFHSHTVTNETFFELIPAAGVARQTSQRFNYQVPAPQYNLDIVLNGAKEDRYNQDVEEARITPLLPFDSDAYLKGSVSRSASQFNHPLRATLVPSSSLVLLPGASEPDMLDSLAALAAEHLLASSIKALKRAHLHQTEWEGIWAAQKAIATGIARVVIPFYGCTKDLSAGNTSTGVIIGCVLDAAFALVPLGQFVGSTVRIILRAGEITVLSVTEQMGTALGRLLASLAQQSALVMVRDAPLLAFSLSKLAWAKLLEQVPSLEKMLSHEAGVATVAVIDEGKYRIPDSLADSWQPAAESQDTRAVVDGITNVTVRNVGTHEAPEFQLLDPYSEKPFGPTLILISDIKAVTSVELVTLTGGLGAGLSRAPAVVPVTLIEEGRFEVAIGESRNVSFLERESGVFDVLVDEHCYRLDGTDAVPALRKLSVEKLSDEAHALQALENLCRPRRGLVPVPCDGALKLVTPPVQQVSESASVTPPGRYSSMAYKAREFKMVQLPRLTPSTSSASGGIDLLVHDGKIVKWDNDVALAGASLPSGSVGQKTLVAVTAEEQLIYALPDAPVYRQQVEGTFSSDRMLGLPSDLEGVQVAQNTAHLPVIELGGIATGIDDSRTLRGIRTQVDGVDWIYVEADTGVVYSARPDIDASVKDLQFSRIEPADKDAFNEFARLSEEYRIVAERPGALRDQDNIARLFYDLVAQSEEFKWKIPRAMQGRSYYEYLVWCIIEDQPNTFLNRAPHILAAEDVQKEFVALAKESIPDFKKIGERTQPEQEDVMNILNHLLPIQGITKWRPLDLGMLVLPATANKISRQIRGANLAYMIIETEADERFVYYALSGGETAKPLKLKLDVADSTERVIEGVTYRDARARMDGRAPDPQFTSLPVVRHADNIIVRDYLRYVDSERLIATVVKEDMKGTPIRRIQVFTLMDTCRSCGGMVLPRLKLDYPGASFSVTYLKHYRLGEVQSPVTPT